ncbi:MAG: glyoxalase/bleomycin resistance/extradiol dioxygenase family protein [Chitinophagaceae bacterium]|jgi:predicted lactoylglutathione lyase|nr:glyoxalase/bleomycin resistance/extradiol dioxygenase family protein [Chitinophagaceae bacterium]
MSAQIFINLPVTDLKRAMAFYTAIGFQNNPMFTDDTAACMALNDQFAVMILTHDKFKAFISKPLGDPKLATSVINAISLASVEAMNTMVDAALANGGHAPMPPMDYGFMQQRSFADPDGNHWEAFYMDISKFPTTQS